MYTKTLPIFISSIVILFGAQTTLADVEYKNIGINSCSQPKVTAPAVSTTTVDLQVDNVQFTGVVNPGNGPTKYWFEYGTKENRLIDSTGFIYAGEDIGNIKAHIKVTGLDLNTTYYYRIVAQNNIDIAYGDIVSFTTN